MLDLLVTYTPVGGGHQAAAMAVAEAARRRGESVELVDAFDYAPRWFGDAYLGAHLAGQGRVPKVYGSAYSAANHRGGALDPLRRGFDHLAFLPLLKFVCDLGPRAVVATHHLPLLVLGRARRRGWLEAPLLGVVTDYTAHACWAEPGVDAFAVACPSARHELLVHGIEPPRVTMTGLPVRQAFEDALDLQAPRANEALRVLVTAGGFGVGPLARVVRSFRGTNGIELTVVCGRAEKLVRRLERVAVEAGVRATVVGFERDMPRRVAEAHVVVGKAGGLTVSEAMTAGRPLVLVGATPGNEAENEKFVVEGGGGIACRPEQVGEEVTLLAASGRLEAYGRRARGLVLHDTAERVVAAAGQLRRTSERAA
jgi:processive 1,2-diacylglycerol beta-glucosyltransferase